MAQINAQSPFERWDGDCGLRHDKPVASKTLADAAHHRPHWIRQLPDRYRAVSSDRFCAICGYLIGLNGAKVEQLSAFGDLVSDVH